MRNPLASKIYKVLLFFFCTKVPHFIKHIPMFVTPHIHHTDNRYKRFSKFCQKIFCSHGDSVMHNATHNAYGFQFSQLLNQHTPCCPLYCVLKFYRTMDAFGHTINEIWFPLCAHDILCDCHAAIQVYRRNFIFIHMLSVIYVAKLHKSNDMKKESYCDKIITYCSSIVTYLTLQP